nr:NADH dehydrogenase subunit 4 [Acinopterus sp.]
MMKFFFMLIFMTPLLILDSWFLVQSILVFYLIVLIFNFPICDYFVSISYGYGLDYVSLGLLILSIMISFLMITSMSNFINSYYSSEFLFMVLIMLLMLFLMFSTLSFLYMYMLIEFVLIPLFIVILGWGYQPERLISGLFLLFYTLFASLPFFFFLVYNFFNKMSMFMDLMLILEGGFLMYFCMLVAFLVKFPMYMVHFWLPSAHVQAPVSGSMLLAGVMLKIGGYGIIRLGFVAENLFLSYSYIWYSFSIYGSLIVSLICFIQGDIKMMIAYSSVSHMGLSILGLMTMSSLGLVGSYLLMIGHGFCSSGLFYVSNLFYNRTLSRSFFINKGLITFMPSLTLMWFLFCAFNMSCPPSINFVSEVLILSSMNYYWGWSFFYFVFISFFCACFSYYMFSYSQHGLYMTMYSFSPFNPLEYLCMFMHLYPLIFLNLILMIIY